MTADDRLSPEVRAVAIVVVIGAIMSILDTTIVNVGLETLSRDLDAPLSTIQNRATGQTNTTYDELRDRINKLLPSQPGEAKPGTGPTTGPGANPNTPPSLNPPATGPSAAMREFQKQINDLSNDLRDDASRVNMGATARSRMGQGIVQGTVPLTDKSQDAKPNTRPFERIELGPDAEDARCARGSQRHELALDRELSLDFEPRRNPVRGHAHQELRLVLGLLVGIEESVRVFERAFRQLHRGRSRHVYGSDVGELP